MNRKCYSIGGEKAYGQFCIAEIDQALDMCTFHVTSSMNSSNMKLPSTCVERASNCVERHLNLNDCSTFLIWSYPQAGQSHLWSQHKCCYHCQCVNAARPTRTRTLRKVLWCKQFNLAQFTAMEQELLEREGESERNDGNTSRLSSHFQ